MTQQHPFTLAPTTPSNAPAQSSCLSIEVMHFQFLLPPDRRHEGPSLHEEDLRVSVFDAFIPMTLLRLHLISETTIYEHAIFGLPLSLPSYNLRRDNFAFFV